MKDSPWLESYAPRIPHQLPDVDRPVYSILQSAAEQYPGQAALVFFGYTMTYRQLWAASQQFACALSAIGLERGQRVVLFLPNCPHFIIAYYGLQSLGAVAVPTNPLYGEKELLFQINDSGAEMLITLDLLFPQVNKVHPRSRLRQIVVGRLQDYLPPIKKLIYPIISQKGNDNINIEEKNGVCFYRRLMNKKYPDRPLPQISGEELAQLQYTGGTTGIAKGAMLTQRNIFSNTRQMRSWYFAIREGREVFISVLPFFHSYGLAVAMNLAIATGSTMIIFPKFAAKDILKAIVQYRATVLPGIPSIYSVLNTYRDIKKYDISSVNYCLSGAAPLPDAVLNEFEQLTGGIILEGYGLSESSPVTHCNPIAGTRKIGSIGLPVTGTDCKIVDTATGEELPRGQTGELCVKGPQVMKGYWQREEETRAALRDGWLMTGDIARMDAQGYFYIVERKKDMIISEGFNIYPRELEEFLLKYDKIADAAVIGVPDKLRGERVLAYVVMHPGRTATGEEIIRYCRDNLVKYKVPRKVFFVEEIPSNIAGKKLRRVLRERAREKPGSGD